MSFTVLKNAALKGKTDDFIEYIFLVPITHKNLVISYVADCLTEAIQNYIINKAVSDLTKCPTKPKEIARTEKLIYERDIPLNECYNNILIEHLHSSKPKKKKKKCKYKYKTYDDDHPDEFLSACLVGRDYIKPEENTGQAEEEPEKEKMQNSPKQNTYEIDKNENERIDSIHSIISKAIHIAYEFADLNIDDAKPIPKSESKTKKAKRIKKGTQRNYSNSPKSIDDISQKPNFLMDNRYEEERKEATNLFMKLNGITVSTSHVQHKMKSIIAHEVTPLCEKWLLQMDIDLLDIMSDIDKANKEVYLTKITCIKELEGMIISCYRMEYPVNLQIYGSFSCNLSIASSDIDVGITGIPITCSNDKIEEYMKITKHLAKNIHFTQVEPILSAKVPILKLEVAFPAQPTIKMDVIIADGTTTCPVTSGLVCIGFVTNIMSSFPYVREVTILVKMLLNIKRYNIPYQGMR